MSAEPRLRDELDRLVPDVGTPDWDEVLRRARTAGRRTRLRAALVVGAVSAACALALVTPLGSAIAQGLGDFSAWLSGQPGEPVSEEEQRAFDDANARSWLGFPAGTQLRRLAAVDAGESTVELLGFRSGETLCLRVVVTGETRGRKQNCAPLQELRTAGAPARVVLVDHGFGRGEQREWYGVDRVSSSALQVTAGIAADGVDALELTDEAGRHTVQVTSNTFLYVADEPAVGQRVREIVARGAGRETRVRFAPAPFGFRAGAAPGQNELPGPNEVERVIRGGEIGWLERREPRGEPLDVVPERQRRHMLQNLVFGRVLSPPAGRPARLAVTINDGGRRVGQLSPSGVCTWLLQGSGAGGGCLPRDELFPDGPIRITMGMGGGSDEFVTAAGLVSDDVHRLVVYLADGQEQELRLADNAFIAVVARSRTPARLVAYDADGKVVGLSHAIVGDVGTGPGPVRGRATSLLEAESAKGSTAEILVHPSTTGGECMFIRYRGTPATGTMVSCGDPDWQRNPLILNAYGNPAEFVIGQVRPGIARVEIRYEDGGTKTVTPTRGYVLHAVPADRISAGRNPESAAGLDEDGKVVATWSLRRPSGRGR